jgi:hypothetical protein
VPTKQATDGAFREASPFFRLCVAGAILLLMGVGLRLGVLPCHHGDDT